jgi:hypothetical protein
MRAFRSALFAALLALPMLSAGCGQRHASYVGIDRARLGRVVIYRNGVAFYERRATLDNGRLDVRVPRERVDDFLKSLTVSDPVTKQPLAVSIPRQQATGGDYLTMTIQTPDPHPHDQVVLTYVTEAPAWKPSYRVFVGDGGKVRLEGWAVVDNTSGEDWNSVLIGVGASSALSFRYDLWSVRSIDRDLLGGEDKLAVAPPVGVSPYAASGNRTSVGQPLVELAPGEVRGSGGRTFEELLGAAAGSQNDSLGTSFSGSTSLENQYVVDGVGTTATNQGITIDRNYIKNIPVPGRAFGETISVHDTVPTIDPAPAPPPPPTAIGEQKLEAIVAGLANDRRDLVIEAHGARGSEGALRAEAEAVRNTLIDDGIAAARIHVATKLDNTSGVRVLAFAPGTAPAATAPATAAGHPDTGDTPVGESHFVAERPMTVKAGTSAMVAVIHGETTGSVVYLYDPLSPRGDDRFAFRSVKLDNPTADTLEPGPMTVYGDNRFIGEGITEPVPPHASVVVPFALDRQIVVSHRARDDDRISKLVTVNRGVVTADLEHRRTTTFTVTSRLAQPSTLLLRHRAEAGWTVVDAPKQSTKVGDSQLYEIALDAGQTRDVEIIETSPSERTFGVSSDDALAMMKEYIAAPDTPPELRAQIAALVATRKTLGDLGDKIATLRDQLAAYRERIGELHAQLVTLKLVKTGGDLMAELQKKMTETSNRIQLATIAEVNAQEQAMLARVKLQDQLADLHLGDAVATAP